MMRIGFTGSVNNLYQINNNNNKNGLISNNQSFGINKNNKDTTLESLFKQKQSILENKSNYIDSSLENGKTWDDMKEQLKVYEKQLSDINDSITQYMSEKQQEALGKGKEDNKKPIDEILNNQQQQQPVQTEEQFQQDQLNRLSSLNFDINQVKTVFSIKNKLEGRSKILNSEISLDTFRGTAPLNSSKNEELKRLEKNIASMNDKMSNGLNALSENMGVDLKSIINKVEDKKTDNNKQEDGKTKVEAYQDLLIQSKQGDYRPVLDVLA